MEILEQFKKLIKEEKYYEAHEVLEEYWHTIRKTSHPYKNVYRGFINAAVALELKKRGRNNCAKVWNNYEKYRELYFKEKKFIEVMKFLDSYKCH
jgi:predicted metal-dependent hydrolase